MGLGPAVCQHCQVLAEYVDPPVKVIRNESTKTASEWTRWICPICGETDPNDNAGFGNWDKYEENEKFLRFMTGKLKTN